MTTSYSKATAGQPIDERSFVVAEEGFVADVLGDADWVLQHKGISRKELALRLNVSEARVSQMFSANGRNLTLRTLARIFHALGENLKVSSPTLEQVRKKAELAPEWSDTANLDPKAFAEMWVTFGGKDAPEGTRRAIGGRSVGHRKAA